MQTSLVLSNSADMPRFPLGNRVNDCGLLTNLFLKSMYKGCANWI